MPTTDKSQRSVAELEAAIIDGDTTVTAEDLQRARAAEDHARLVAEAENHRAFRAAEAARAADIEQLRGDIAALADDRDQVLALARNAAEALGELFVAARGRGEALNALAGRARVLGIQPMGLDDEIRDESGIGWRHNWQTPGPARIRLGDTRAGRC